MNRAPEHPVGNPSPFYYMSLRMQDVTGDGGVLKEVLRPGLGNVIPSTATVSVHYSAYSEYTDKPFDSNVQRNMPRFLKAEQINYPLDKLLKVANTEREFGNHFFHKKQYEDAKDQYKKALSVFAHHQPVDEDEIQKIHSSKLLLFLNLSLMCLKLNAPSRALVYGEKALQIESKHPKALFRCGQACILLLEYDKAKDFLVKAQKLEPFNPDINCALVKLNRIPANLMVQWTNGICAETTENIKPTNV
ncbi:inactive peptidyl-prolyl cis-trans isomerase FKBP6 isoform X3 [Narcine bancroftii]|uniref:inactive peptidyl-prolyl cis-trans isomerase FKBP6 isoform X3 n=1 Tax=Narcine bancroftii TaxID=1343680 RepID=UPI003831101C